MPKGKTTTQPIPQEELDKLTALVQETVGFDQQRGDSVKVVNTPFQVVKEEPDNTPSGSAQKRWMCCVLWRCLGL